jgi:hypothetical protein
MRRDIAQEESDCRQKACVRVMRHTRPFSISLYHSSRVPIGLRMAPDTDRIGVSQAGLPGLLLFGAVLFG